MVEPRKLSMTPAMARPIPSRGDILRCLRAQRRGLHLTEIASRLSVSPASRRRLSQFLGQLVVEGVVVGLPGHRFRAEGPDSSAETWPGVLSMSARGFGFVNAPGQDDVFIAPDAVGGAMHGDGVVVSVVGRTPRGLEGRIESVTERRQTRVCGVLRRRARSAYLEPDDSRVRGPIVLLGKRTRADQDGVAAVVRVTRFPSTADELPEGELIEVIGKPGEAQVEVAKILARDRISEERDPAALDEALQRARDLWPLSMKGRRDLRSVPLLTIDPADARDHDDAVHVERRAEGYRVYVAIADVSEYVLAGTAIDREAFERGFTTYLPDRAVPMLPPVLAADHCSLLPHQDRFSMVAIIDLDRSAVVKRFRLVEAVIHVAARLSYEEVAAVLRMTKGGPPSEAAERYKKDLRVLAELSRKTRRARMKRGALDLDLPEPKVELDAEGRPLSVTRRGKNPGISGAYQMIEEMMLMANERVARWLGGRRSPGVYRIHAPPDEERLEQLEKAARLIGVPFDRDALSTPLGVSKWLQRIDAHPLRVVLEGLLLRSLKQAQYGVDNIGHFGLASDAYVHFTSPIRRYSDLLVHRIAKDLLRGGKPMTDAGQLEHLRAQAARISDQERVVMQAEREVVDVYRCLLMQDKVGEFYEGRVAGIGGGGLYVVLDEPFVDVLVRFEALGPDRYDPSDDGLRVEGQRSGERIALGDRMMLEIEDVALLRRTIYGRRLATGGVPLPGARPETEAEEGDPPPPRSEPPRPRRKGRRLAAPEGEPAPRPGRRGPAPAGGRDRSSSPGRRRR